MKLPVVPDMQAIQRRVVPSTAAAAVQHSDMIDSRSSPSWCAARPGLLQWLTILTEEAAAAAASAAVLEATPAAAAAAAEPSSEAKLVVVAGPPAFEHTELQLYIAASSSLSVVILDLQDGCRPDMPSRPGMLSTPGMLSMPIDCVAPLLSSMQGSMLSIGDNPGYMNKVFNGLLPAKLLFKKDLGVTEMLSATCTALGAAQAKHEQPIHGIVFLSWSCLQKDLPLKLGMSVTDLYLCDLADCITPHGKTPVTEMAAKALAMVTTFLCGAHNSAKQRPRLWMDSGSHNLLDEFLSSTRQVFEQDELGGRATAELEHHLLLHVMSHDNHEFRVALCEHLKELLEADNDLPAQRKLLESLSPDCVGGLPSGQEQAAATQQFHRCIEEHGWDAMRQRPEQAQLFPATDAPSSAGPVPATDLLSSAGQLPTIIPLSSAGQLPASTTSPSHLPSSAVGHVVSSRLILPFPLAPSSAAASLVPATKAQSPAACVHEVLQTSQVSQLQHASSSMPALPIAPQLQLQAQHRSSLAPAQLQSQTLSCPSLPPEQTQQTTGTTAVAMIHPEQPVGATAVTLIHSEQPVGAIPMDAMNPAQQHVMSQRVTGSFVAAEQAPDSAQISTAVALQASPSPRLTTAAANAPVAPRLDQGSLELGSEEDALQMSAEQALSEQPLSENAASRLASDAEAKVLNAWQPSSFPTATHTHQLAQHPTDTAPDLPSPQHTTSTADALLQLPLPAAATAAAAHEAASEATHGIAKPASIVPASANFGPILASTAGIHPQQSANMADKRPSVSATVVDAQTPSSVTHAPIIPLMRAASPADASAGPKSAPLAASPTAADGSAGELHAMPGTTFSSAVGAAEPRQGLQGSDRDCRAASGIAGHRPALQGPDRDASIAQVLASLNGLPLQSARCMQTPAANSPPWKPDKPWDQPWEPTTAGLKGQLKRSAPAADAEGQMPKRPRPSPPLNTASSALDADLPAFPWQQSLGLISPLKIGSQDRSHTTPAAMHDSCDPISPQALFGHPGRHSQPQLDTQVQFSECLNVGQQQQQQLLSQREGLGTQQIDQPKVSGSSGLGPGMQPPPGFAHAGMDRVGTTGSAFSAWAPLQAHSMPSMQGTQGNFLVGLGSSMPVITGAVPNASASAAWSDSGLALPGSMANTGLHRAALPPGLQTPAMPTVALSAVPSGQNLAAVPGIAPIACGSQLNPSATGYSPFSDLVPNMPFLGPSPYLPSQWPIMHGLTHSQPPFLPQLSYRAPPYPLGFAQLPLHPPYHLPSNSPSPVCVPASFQQIPHQLSGHLLHHLPPFLPSPMQTLIPSQAPPLNPQLNSQLNPSAASQALHVKPEPKSDARASHPLQPEQWKGQHLPQCLSQQKPSAAQQKPSSSAKSLGQHAGAARASPSVAASHGKAGKDAKPGSLGSKRQLEEGNKGCAGLEQQGRGNKRCRLGPTEQLRVVVRQILAGVSREGKKHIRTSTASKGDLQLFIQLALGETYDPALPPDLAVPRALSQVLKEDISKSQADKWLRRSNSGAPYFVVPELEDKLHAAQVTWPPCNEDKLRKFRWDTVQPTTGSQLVSTELSSHFSLQQPEQRSSSDFNSEGLRSAYTEDAAATPSIGSPPSQGQTSFAGLHTSGAHLY